MKFRRTYTTYSIALAVAWAIVLALVALKPGANKWPVFLLVSLGYFLGWCSGTIARFMYPPPARWLRSENATPTSTSQQ